jgi:hypothetical protein
MVPHHPVKPMSNFDSNSEREALSIVEESTMARYTSPHSTTESLKYRILGFLQGKLG